MAKTQAESNLDDPAEMFAWMFTAGVPDPRDKDGKFPNQPLIPPMCFPVLSEMLYKMGARFHPELQTMWVKKPVGPERNFQANGTTEIKPEDIQGDVAAMMAEQFPDIAERLKQVTPATHQAALEETSKELLANLAELAKAREKMEGGSA